MNEKEMLTAKIEAISRQEVIENDAPWIALAKLANQPYDAEFPIPEVIEAILRTATIERGGDYEYFTQSAATKRVYTVTNGSVTQTAVTPGSPSDLSFSSYDTDEYYVYLEKLLEAKYDPIALKAEEAMESLNRLEIKTVLDLLIAAAEGQSNTFALDSGDSVFDFEKCVEMVRSLAKYGTKLVLITGADVTTDCILMDYNDNKQREVSPEKAGVSQWIKIESLTYEHSGTKTVLASDKAILVATSDSKANKPGDFVRRLVRGIDGASDKERVIISSGPAKHVGSNRKLAYGIIAFEQFGTVVTNPLAVAVFKRASSYS